MPEVRRNGKQCDPGGATQGHECRFAPTGLFCLTFTLLLYGFFPTSINTVVNGALFITVTRLAAKSSCGGEIEEANPVFNSSAALTCWGNSEIGNACRVSIFSLDSALMLTPVLMVNAIPAGKFLSLIHGPAPTPVLGAFVGFHPALCNASLISSARPADSWSANIPENPNSVPLKAFNAEINAVTLVSDLDFLRRFSSAWALLAS